MRWTPSTEHTKSLASSIRRFRTSSRHLARLKAAHSAQRDPFQPPRQFDAIRVGLRSQRFQQSATKLVVRKRLLEELLPLGVFGEIVLQPVRRHDRLA